jgi:hypothetical protein
LKSRQGLVRGQARSVRQPWAADGNSDDMIVDGNPDRHFGDERSSHDAVAGLNTDCAN